MKMRFSVIVLAMLVGCSSNPQMRDQDIKPVPVSAEQRLGMARAGQAVVFEGYVYNGVIVTPARNYYFGQTDGYPKGDRVVSDCFIDEESVAAGGEVTPECAEYFKRGQADSLQVEMEVAEERPVPLPVDSGNPYYDELLVEVLKLDPNAQSDLFDRTISFVNAPTPRFAAGSAKVTESDRSRLGDFAQRLTNVGENLIVLVSGFTSSEGPADLNDSLARRRALAVREVLVNNGARSDFMVAFAAPQCCYLNNNRTPKERSANRRVELSPGGRYTDSGTVLPVKVAPAIARMKKHMQANPGITVRVHVQATNVEMAQRVMRDVMAVMNRPEVGFRSIEAGVVSYGDMENVIIEVKS